MSEPQKNNVPNTSSSGTNNAALSGNPNAPAADSTGAAIQNNAPNAAISVNKTPTNSANSGGNNPHNSVNADTVQFSSAMTAKAEQPKDYFAEQNAKQAEAKQASAKTRKRLLIILGAVIGVIVIALVAWLVVWLNSEPEVVYTGETIYFNDETIAENIVDLRKLAQNAFNKTDNNGSENSESGEGAELGNDIAAAEVVFAHALSVPENKNYASQINLAKELFYQNNGYYEQLLENKDKVNPNDLTAEQRAAYYNAVSMAYYYTGDKAKSEEYMHLTQDAQSELGEFGG